MDALLKQIFDKLERRSAVAVSEAFLSKVSESKGTQVSLHFLYYANAEMRHLFDPAKRTAEDLEYWNALLDADFLLPDGIALSLCFARYLFPEKSPIELIASYRKHADTALPNLNGTDFLPILFGGVSKNPDMSAFLYGAKRGVVEKASERIGESFGCPIGFCDGYAPFDVKKFESAPGSVKILFVGLGSPKQEIWCSKNAINVKAAGCVSVWGFFDFLWGAETRAPDWVRNFRLEWFWRLVGNPKKNGKKVMASLRFFPRFAKGFK